MVFVFNLTIQSCDNILKVNIKSSNFRDHHHKLTFQGEIGCCSPFCTFGLIKLIDKIYTVFISKPVLRESQSPQPDKAENYTQ